VTKFKSFEPQPRDFFRTTDPNAFGPLVPFIVNKTYAEPCCGAGDLKYGIGLYARCNWLSDIEPQHADVIKKDAVDLTEEDVKDCDIIISNPPFSWHMLQPLLDHLPTLRPTWMLLPSDFAFNKQSRPYMDKCSNMVSVGRLFFHKAGEDPMVTKYSRGTANNAWYLFHDSLQQTIFTGWTSK
jgi:hypothetical protein